MSEERWVVSLHYPSGVLGFVSIKPKLMTTKLNAAKVWDSYDEAKHERDMTAARIPVMKRRQISVITYDEAVTRITAKAITDG